MAEPKRVTNRENVGVVKTGERASSNGRASAGRIIGGRPRSVAWGACATPHATAEATPRNLHQSSSGEQGQKLRRPGPLGPGPQAGRLDRSGGAIRLGGLP